LASVRLTIFKGRFLNQAGRIPSDRIEKAAAHRVKGRNQAVACKKSFCCCLFIMI
jgi:hypothetical protein